jgi:Zn finger protein HypA/HybF involved in hydrogenase expression
MVDTSAFADLVASLRSAVEITKAMMDIGDTSRVPAKLFELMREIMTAQSSALVSHSAHLELLESKRGLEEEVAKLKAWNMEKYRYELQSVGPGAIAYVPKQSMRGTEPIHWICADCFQSGKKRFLNESHSDLHFVYHKCQECSGKIRVRRTSSFASVGGVAGV